MCVCRGDVHLPLSAPGLDAHQTGAADRGLLGDGAHIGGTRYEWPTTRSNPEPPAPSSFQMWRRVSVCKHPLPIIPLISPFIREEVVGAGEGEEGEGEEEKGVGKGRRAIVSEIESEKQRLDE